MNAHEIRGELFLEGLERIVNEILALPDVLTVVYFWSA